jgi:hypothetical protein
MSATANVKTHVRLKPVGRRFARVAATATVAPGAVAEADSAVIVALTVRVNTPSVTVMRIVS